MALTSRQRNLIIAFLMVLAIAAIVGAFFLGRRGGEKATTATTPTATQTTQTQTTPTQTQTVQTVTVPAEPAPSPAPASSLEIISRRVVPEEVSAGMPMEFIAEVRGNATMVTMTIRGPVDSTLNLERGVTTPAGLTIWRKTASAPGVPGVYRYYATATAPDGSTVEMPGVSGWSFQVTP